MRTSIAGAALLLAGAGAAGLAAAADTNGNGIALERIRHAVRRHQERRLRGVHRAVRGLGHQPDHIPRRRLARRRRQHGPEPSGDQPDVERAQEHRVLRDHDSVYTTPAVASAPGLTAGLLVGLDGVAITANQVMSCSSGSAQRLRRLGRHARPFGWQWHRHRRDVHLRRLDRHALQEPAFVRRAGGPLLRPHPRRPVQLRQRHAQVADQELEEPVHHRLRARATRPAPPVSRTPGAAATSRARPTPSSASSTRRPAPRATARAPAWPSVSARCRRSSSAGASGRGPEVEPVLQLGGRQHRPRPVSLGRLGRLLGPRSGPHDLRDGRRHGVCEGFKNLATSGGNFAGDLGVVLPILDSRLGRHAPPATSIPQATGLQRVLPAVRGVQAATRRASTRASSARTAPPPIGGNLCFMPCRHRHRARSALRRDEPDQVRRRRRWQARRSPVQPRDDGCRRARSRRAQPSAPAPFQFSVDATPDAPRS